MTNRHNCTVEQIKAALNQKKCIHGKGGKCLRWRCDDFTQVIVKLGLAACERYETSRESKDYMSPDPESIELDVFRRIVSDAGWVQG